MYALRGVGFRMRSLWLPGSDGLCVKKAVERGIINRYSHTVFVERDEPTFQRIKRSAGRWVGETLHKPLLHNGQIFDLQLPWMIDYSFLDFMGTLDQKTTFWLQDYLAPNLDDGATICLTHAYGFRNNQFLASLRTDFKEGEWKDLYRKLSDESRIKDDNILIPLAVLHCVFSEFQFEIKPPLKYQDSRRSMLLYRLDNFTRDHGPNGWPIFTGECEMAGNRQAALKAWATRRGQATAVEPIEGNTVVEMILNATTAGKKAAATKKLQKFVAQQSAKGKRPTMVKAGIMARVSRIRNQS